MMTLIPPDLGDAAVVRATHWRVRVRGGYITRGPASWELTPDPENAHLLDGYVPAATLAEDVSDAFDGAWVEPVPHQTTEQQETTTP